MRHQPTPQTWLKALSRVNTQVICVKTILSSALLAFGYCISRLFHKSRTRNLYRGVSSAQTGFFLRLRLPNVKRTGGKIVK